MTTTQVIVINTIMASITIALTYRGYKDYKYRHAAFNPKRRGK